ncbi:hypothetical protein IMY05_001G0005000 [Salix suchowensis]|nr:hypothetical protein IMY05_001G0004500 [Salix suchowensis]KAG5252395.1 hypothetical protein IMY05_001G0005000 [Salix suchowensis]
MGFSYFSYDQECAYKILQEKQTIPSITLFRMNSYHAVNADNKLEASNNVFDRRYHDDFYDHVYDETLDNSIDWSCFEKLVAELIEELELSILQKPLLKDDIAVQREDGDEVEGEIILWRPALKQINAWIPRKSKGTSIDLL